MRRWYEIASLVWGVCGLLLIGCGSVEMEEPIEQEHEESTDSACLNCNQDEVDEEEQDLAPTSSVRRFLEELCFTVTSTTTKWRAFLVKNLTHSSVLITQSCVETNSACTALEAEILPDRLEQWRRQPSGAW